MTVRPVHTATRTIRAPVSGWIVPLDDVPDPVFAGRMVGDGVAIEPTSATVVAPCDGTVAFVHPSGHAVTIRMDDGIELLIHVGLDTVELKGDGFTPLVAAGREVSTGDPLIEVDIDRVSRRARSLLTEVIVATMDRVASIVAHQGAVVAGTDAIFEIHTQAGVATEAAASDAVEVVSEPIVIANPTGLHARPAAVLAASAKAFRGRVVVRAGHGEANAKSVVSIMGLEIESGATVRIVATGDDAAAAVSAVSAAIRSGLGEEIAGASFVPKPVSKPDPVVTQGTEDPDELRGIAASPGLAVGRVFQVRHAIPSIVELARDPNAERRGLEAAIRTAVAQLDALERTLAAKSDPGKAAIFAAHREMLDDPELLADAEARIAAGKTAAFAVYHAVGVRADRLAGLKNELLAARANDLRDAGLRVVRVLTGDTNTSIDAPENAILVAEDLSPSDTASLDRSRVLGFCTTRGGATSHVAILARSLDIPAIAGIDPRALHLGDGTEVILDGSTGRLRTRPSAAEITDIRERRVRHEAQRRVDLERASEPATTIDGHRIEVVANVGGANEAANIVASGGEGIGLLRSEFLFLDRATAPSEDEQADAYAAVVAAVGPDRPVIIRTLDVGGDKQLAYLPIPAEDNPFLGERGIRVGLGRPELLRTQVRAILRARRDGDVRIMFPMIGSVGELRTARAIVEEERERLGVAALQIGIMVEVPSAALIADRLAEHADFFSIGTNDLTQYTLAVDRGHPTLAGLADGLHPAVLNLIAMTSRAAHAAGRWVGVCGGIAGDAAAIPILVGLGIDELSVAIPVIPTIKAKIRELSREECRDLAARALACATADDVRALSPTRRHGTGEEYQ